MNTHDQHLLNMQLNHASNILNNLLELLLVSGLDEEIGYLTTARAQLENLKTCKTNAK
jgi:uncharacterized small protein (DUF1192 family)